MSWKLDELMLKHFNKKSLPKWQWFFVMTAHVFFLAITLYALPIMYLYLNNSILAIIQITFFAISTICIGYFLKAVILRPRPHNHVTYLGKTDSSFPSSHASVAFGLAYILSIYLPTLSIVWIILAMLVGLGRIYIQMHYLSDVIGGIFIGLILAFITLIFISPSLVLT